MPSKAVSGKLGQDCTGFRFTVITAERENQKREGVVAKPKFQWKRRGVLFTCEGHKTVNKARFEREKRTESSQLHTMFAGSERF